jgi:hypothetical protein
MFDTRPRGAPVALAVIAASCWIAACGSSSSTTSGAAASASATTTSAGGAGSASGTGTTGRGAFSPARRAALVACLKSHGVTLPSRPAGAGGGPPPSGGSGTSTTGSQRGSFFRSNPKVATALKDCGANFGFGRGAGLARVSHQAILNYVACVRQHGYDLPTPNFSGHGAIFPANIRSNPKFEAASRQCQSLLVRPGGGGSSTTAGTSTA